MDIFQIDYVCTYMHIVHFHKIWMIIITIENMSIRIQKRKTTTNEMRLQKLFFKQFQDDDTSWSFTLIQKIFP